MRAPLKYLAPLILVPFLACTDTPIEPGSQARTPLMGWWPAEPGDYIVASVNGCGQAIPGGAHYSYAFLAFGEEGEAWCSVTDDVDEKTGWVVTPEAATSIEWNLLVQVGGAHACAASGSAFISDLPVRIPGPGSDCSETKVRFLLDRIILE